MANKETTGYAYYCIVRMHVSDKQLSYCLSSFISWYIAHEWAAKLGKTLMASHDSKKIIYAALIGNLAIAIIKYGASYVTNSSAMLSEAIHSL